MAKITQYKDKDNYPLYLYFVPAALITWFSIAAQMSSSWYYLGALVISHMWGTASYERTPKMYNNVKSARMTYLFMGIMLAVSVSFITLVFRNPEIILEYLGPSSSNTPAP